MMKRSFFFSILLLIFSLSLFGQDKASEKEEAKEDKKKQDANPPSFPGGESAMAEFISNELEYPEDAEEAGAEGVAEVAFVVEPTGELSHFRVLNEDLHESLKGEALRVCKSMPKWEPGRQKGSEVAVEILIPIRFDL